MEYQEITKKDGTHVVFCHFEDLIPEAFGCTLEELEARESGKSEYIGHCPFCKAEGHRKHKLYIKSDLSVGHCFVCGRAFSNINDEVDTSFEVPDFFGYSLCSQDLTVESLDDPDWTLEKYFTEFDSFSEKGIEYLKSRHKYLEQLWQPLEFKFLNDNIVIPFKYHNKLFYYQIRFSGNSSIRYFHPHIKAGCKPPYIIENCVNPKNFIICEGVFDAISLLVQAPDYTPFAVLGSAITDYQIKFLREYLPEKILIMMDETSISKKIYDKLKTVIDYCPIKIIKTYGHDPEEILKWKINKNQNICWIK